MKKTSIFTVLFLLAIVAYGQNLQKGNLLGLHVMTVQLKPGVTQEQFNTFFATKVIPAYENEFKDVKGYLVKGVRGENANAVGILWIFKNEKARDRYFNADGTTNDLGNKAVEKLNSTRSELEKYGTYTSKYTDWVAQ